MPQGKLISLLDLHVLIKYNGRDKWHVAQGDTVAKNYALAMISIQKASELSNPSA